MISQRFNKHTPAMMYSLLGLVAGSMILLNLLSYFLIMRISQIYAEQSSASVNLKIKILTVDMIVRDMIEGKSSRDINGIWGALDEANTYVAAIEKGVPGCGIGASIIQFREFLLDSFVKEKEPEEQNKKSTKVEQEEEKEKFKEEYNTKFDELMKGISSVESAIGDNISRKIFIFKVIYVALMFNIFLMFAAAVFLIARYVGKRVIAEEELGNTKNKLDIILNSMDSILIILDSRMNIEGFNIAARKYFRIDAENAIGLHFRDVLPMLKVFEAEIAKALYSGKFSELHREKMLFGDGTQRVYNMSFNPLTKEHAGIVLRIDDITSHEIRDEQVKQSQKMEIVENIMDNLANDFNNVLGAVTASVSMMKISLEKDGDKFPPDFRNNIDILENSIERALVMTRQLSSISAKHEFVPSPVDLNQAVYHILLLCEKSSEGKISIVPSYSDIRPVVMADPALIEVALLNLCENAIQAMTIMRESKEEWGGSLNVSVFYLLPDRKFIEAHPDASSSSYWAVRISDTGVGISPDIIPRIFDPFFTTKGKNPGTGPGLSEIKEIIEEHNGFIDLSSIPGSGSSFTVYIPEMEDEEGKSAASSSPKQDPIPTGVGTILVVDDEAIMRKTAQSILSKLGYEVIFAENGMKAIELYKVKFQEILAVMLDLSMPRMDGRETFVELKKINPAIKALMVSGMDTDRRIQEALSLGAKGFVAKPYSMVTLANEIKNISR